MNRIVATCLLACGLAASSPAAADSFRSLPAEKAGQSTPLELKVVQYDGNSNGLITVDVKNPTGKPQEFSAKGLYFVPAGNADQAPQRVGAVGPFQVQRPQGPERRDHLTIAPGATERLTLDVYCIDSHRGSPSSSTGFRMAKERVPQKLSDDIARDAHQAAQGLGGVAAPEAKSAVQSQVWKNRDKKWLKLEGEGAQEAGK